MHIQGGHYSHNGQIGIVGNHGGVVLDSVEIAFNNYARFDAGWEAGGTKFSYADGLVVRNSCVHNNYGPGLWTDIDNRNILYEKNKVFENASDGIKHEISFDAVIRNNVSARNGYGHDIWAWGSQILIQNSSNVQVYDNVAEVSPDYGNGVSIVYQERGTGKLGEYRSSGNTIRNNLVIYRGKRGLGGIFADHEREKFYSDKTNILDKNKYVAPSPDHRYWEVGVGEVTWDALQKAGSERNGTFKIESRAPLPLSCDS